MVEITGKSIERYLYRLFRKSKTCLIHGPGHFSGEFKVLVYFRANYAKFKPTKGHRNHPVPRKKINRQQENKDIVNNVVDEILLNETQKVDTAREAT